ncbi:hypothetical protein V6N11_026236 [Hibiscus sabdariffa]|uniref:Uncharacterized protein n=1 Tax=Hibiscus sabdariffa TaxID=183260 RepID=A0ABR2SV04_9ROSI
MATPPIRYEMNDENQFMLCRSCRNHLGALGSNCYGQAFDGLVCLTADNVRTDETPTSTLDRMLYWDGTRGLRDAATHDPVDNDPRPLKNESPENKR